MLASQRSGVLGHFLCLAIGHEQVHDRARCLLDDRRGRPYDTAIDVVRISRDERFHIRHDARRRRHDDIVRLQVALVELVVGQARLAVVEWTVAVPHRKVITHKRIVAGSGPAGASGPEIEPRQVIRKRAPSPTGLVPCRAWMAADGERRTSWRVFDAAASTAFCAAVADWQRGPQPRDAILDGLARTAVRHPRIAATCPGPSMPGESVRVWPVQARLAVIKQELPQHTAERSFVVKRVDTAAAVRMGLINEVAPMSS